MCVIIVHEMVGKMYIANVFSSASVTCVSEQPCTVSELLKS